MPTEETTFISSSDLKSLTATEQACIIDIRENDEYQRCHIPNAHNLPLSQLNQSNIKNLAKGKTVVFHCQSGNRTHQALAQFKALGLETFCILQSGLNDWQKNGGDVIHNHKAPFPIMRQVQIIVGSMVLLSTLLGYFVNINFIWMSAFFGAGLLFAGLSGTCALASLLMKLPFNQIKS